jgi:hypothetical protein
MRPPRARARAGQIHRPGARAAAAGASRPVPRDRPCPAEHGVEQRDDLGEGIAAGRQAQPADPRLAQGIALRDQALQRRALGLDAVERQEGLALAGLEQQAVGVVAAAELAVVLLQPVVARREAARREGQRQAAEAPDLGGDGRGLRVDARHRVERQLDRRHPAVGAELRVLLQRVGVVDVEVRAERERFVPAARQHRQRTGVAGLDRELVLLADAAQAAQLGLAHHQRHGGQAHVLAGRAQLARNGQPVLELDLVAARADQLAQHDALHRRVGQLGVEVEQRVARPPVKQRSDAEFDAGHVHVFTHRHGRS